MKRTDVPKIGDIVRIKDEEGNSQEEIVISFENGFKNGCTFYFKEHGRSDSHHWYTLNADNTWQYSGTIKGKLKSRSEVKIIGKMNNIDYFDIDARFED